MKNPVSNLVYSTLGGKMCPLCGRPQKECICKQLAAKKSFSGNGTVRIGLETKGRNGKGVTVITGLPLTSDKLENLAKKLKQTCGCGGTVKDGTIEIQGDKREQLLIEIRKMGFNARISGG